MEIITLKRPLFMGCKQFFTKTMQSDGLAQQVHEAIMPGLQSENWDDGSTNKTAG